jgi:uncharacterized RDD family membrane protein YckC
MMRTLYKRVLATVLDYFLFFSICYLYVDLIGVELKDGTKVVSGLATIPVFVFWFLYFVLMEAIFSGTISHLALGLRIVSIQGTKASFVQILKRRIMDPLDFFLFGLPAYFVARYSPMSQRIGDLWAGTVVAALVGK